MWISREDMDKIERRLAALENRKDADCGAMDHVNFTVYNDKDNLWNFSTTPRKTISVKDAIYHILSHLGLRLTYTEGTPAKVILTPQTTIAIKVPKIYNKRSK